MVLFLSDTYIKPHYRWHITKQTIVNRALTNIQLNKPRCRGTEFIIIVLPHGNIFLRDNPNPRTRSVALGTPLSVRPYRGPYIGYWPSRASFDEVHWHKIVWNEHLPIGYNVRINFNDILNHLTDDDDGGEDDEEEVNDDNGEEDHDYDE